jgi:hypothetical protein
LKSYLELFDRKLRQLLAKPFHGLFKSLLVAELLLDTVLIDHPLEGLRLNSWWKSWNVQLILLHEPVELGRVAGPNFSAVNVDHPAERALARLGLLALHNRGDRFHHAGLFPRILLNGRGWQRSDQT